MAATTYIERAYIDNMPIETRVIKKNPLRTESRTKTSETPTKPPDTTRIEFLLSLSLALCVNQSTAVIKGKKAISGRNTSAGSLNPSTLAAKTAAMPKAVPVHLEHK